MMGSNESRPVACCVKPQGEGDVEVYTTATHPEVVVDSTPVQLEESDYLSSLITEKEELYKRTEDGSFKHAHTLIEKEIEKISLTPSKNEDFSSGDNAHLVSMLLDKEEPTLKEVVLVPVEEYPNYNFVGRLMGPRGTTAKKLEQQTGCRITIRGREQYKPAQMKPRCTAGCSSAQKEPLRVEIQCRASDPDAAKKMEHAVRIINAILVPPSDGHDELKRQQLTELAIINGTYHPMGPSGDRASPRRQCP